MATRKLQDLLRKQILREALDPIATVELEKAVAPLDEQRIDGYCELRPERPPPSALPHLGLLRRMAELAQRSLVEQFSGTTTLEAVDDLLRKKFHLHHALKKQARGTPIPKPVLWVLSAGHPREVLAECNGVPAGDGQSDGSWDRDGAEQGPWPPGFYRCVPVLRMWVVVLAELPRTPDTRMLRLFGPPPMQSEVLREIGELPRDAPELPPWIDILAEVGYLFEQESDLKPEEEAVMTELRKRWEQEKADLRRAGELAGMKEGMQEGKKEGMKEGKKEGRVEAILSVMKTRGLAVSEQTRARITACTDLAVLEQWLARACTASSEAEVVAG